MILNENVKSQIVVEKMNTGQCVYHCNIARHGRPQRFYTKYKRHKWCPMVIRFLRRAFFSLFPLHVVVVVFLSFFLSTFHHYHHQLGLMNSSGCESADFFFLLLFTYRLYDFYVVQILYYIVFAIHTFEVRLVGKNYYTFSMVSITTSFDGCDTVRYLKKKQHNSNMNDSMRIVRGVLQIPSVIGLETSHSNNQIELIGYRRIDDFLLLRYKLWVCVCVCVLLAVFIEKQIFSLVSLNLFTLSTHRWICLNMFCCL